MKEITFSPSLDNIQCAMIKRAKMIVETFPFNQCDANCSSDQWQAMQDLIEQHLIDVWADGWKEAESGRYHQCQG